MAAERRAEGVEGLRKRRAAAAVAEREWKVARCETQARRGGVESGGGGGKRRRTLLSPGGSGVAGWAPMPTLQSVMFAEAGAQKRREDLKRWRDGAVGRDDIIHCGKQSRV